MPFEADMRIPLSVGLNKNWIIHLMRETNDYINEDYPDFDTELQYYCLQAEDELVSAIFDGFDYEGIDNWFIDNYTEICGLNPDWFIKPNDEISDEE